MPDQMKYKYVSIYNGFNFSLKLLYNLLINGNVFWFILNTTIAKCLLSLLH